MFVGYVSIFAGGGSTFLDGIGTTAEFGRPAGLAVDTLGTLIYIADSTNHLIRMLNVSGIDHYHSCVPLLIVFY